MRPAREQGENFQLCGWTPRGASNQTPTFANPALTRSLRLLRIRGLLIWEWVANPTPRLHRHKWHADRSLDCNRTVRKIVLERVFRACFLDDVYNDSY